LECELNRLAEVILGKSLICCDSIGVIVADDRCKQETLVRLPKKSDRSCYPARRIARALPVTFVWLAAFPSPLLALDPEKVLTQYQHTAWTRMNGSEPIPAPPITALAQTDDGYLWVGTQKGLWRFDGVRFESSWLATGDSLPSEDIWSLCATRDGALWIGTAKGLCKLEHGRLFRYATANDAASGSIRALFEDHFGTLWAGSGGYRNSGLIHFDGSQIKTYGVSDGLPDVGVNCIFEDHERNLWVGTRRGLCRWRPGRPQVFLTNPPAVVESITENEEGQLVIVKFGSPSILKMVNGRFEPVAASRLEGRISQWVALTDRADKNLWLGSFSEGLIRINRLGVHRLDRKDGLSASGVQVLFEDREGNLWVGTRGGLDRFRDTKIPRVSVSEGLSEDIVTALCASRSGGALVGTANGGLDWIHGSEIQHIGRSAGLPSLTVFSLFENTDGTLWIGTSAGLVFGAPGRFRPVRGPRKEALRRVTAITGDRSGNIWAFDGHEGLLRVGPHTAEPVRLDLPRQNDLYPLLADRKNRLWAGYYQGVLAMVEGERVTRFDERNGLSRGPILALSEDGEGAIWAGTGGGLNRFRNGRWTTWTTANGLPSGGIYSIVNNGPKNLWLRTETAVVRLNGEELSRQGDGSPQRLSLLDYYSAADDVPVQARAVLGQPRAAQSLDGRFWFATEEGVSVINQGRVRKNTRPPNVVLERLTVDNRVMALDAKTSNPLTFRGRELQFDFTALSLTDPKNVLFRYQLQGFKDEWVDAGTRRQAFYTNLPPGSYKFRVVACNNDGVWNTTGTSLEFVLLPAFYQTRWFQLLCFAAACGLLWTAYVLRMAKFRREFEVRMNERVGERLRIARELHDTLLQSVVGASLQLDALANRLPGSVGWARDALAHIRKQIDQALREVRQSVRVLRSASVAPDFVSVLREFGEHAAPQGTVFGMHVEGAVRRPGADVEDQLLRIGQEAITNAFRHSGATELAVRVSFEPRHVRLSITDNGRGIDPALLKAGRPGHFGIATMRERAECINAVFDIDTRKGGGTTVNVRVDGRRFLGLWNRPSRIWAALTALARPRTDDKFERS
jgi:signal transduction histidine kinase/ligand-binding sensor domain-containing protein